MIHQVIKSRAGKALASRNRIVLCVLYVLSLCFSMTLLAQTSEDRLTTAGGERLITAGGQRIITAGGQRIITAGGQRIITAGGTVTEIVFALGAGDRVIAVDQSSQYPAIVRDLPKIGYYRELAAEGVLSFAPHKILAIEGVGRKEVVQQIENTGVEVVVYNKPTSTDGMIALITQLGRDLGKHQEARQLIAQFKTSLPEASTNITAKAVFLLSASDRGLIAAGTDTVPQLIFSYAGIENIAAQHQGFKGINNEVLALQQPDFLVAPYHVVMGAGGKDKFCQSPNLALLEAAQECRLLIMDSLMSLGMTPRLAEAIAIVKNWQQENS